MRRSRRKSAVLEVLPTRLRCRAVLASGADRLEVANIQEIHNVLGHRGGITSIVDDNSGSDSGRWIGFRLGVADVDAGDIHCGRF